MSKTAQRLLTATAVIGMLGMGSIALAATNALTCFSGTSDATIYGGTCTINSNGTVTLANNDTNINGDYAGVYFASSTLNGQTLSSVTQLGYTYVGSTTPSPGDLSLNIPVATSTTDISGAYAYVDAFYCPGTGGVVDIIHDPVCGIWYNGVEYANWAAFVAAFPGATINGIPFIVAERTPSEGPAVWTISNIQLGGPTTVTATSKAQCMNGGWQTMTRANGSTFKNQGDCIQYINTGK